MPEQQAHVGVDRKKIKKRSSGCGIGRKHQNNSGALNEISTFSTGD